jgi:hypothetical protein
MKVLFLNHPKTQCGVYWYGYRLWNIWCKSDKYKIDYKEISTLKEYQSISFSEYSVIIYNYHTTTMPWLQPNTINKYTKSVGIWHEFIIERQMFDTILDVSTDIPRPIFETITNSITSMDPEIIHFLTYSKDNVPIIGSFGLGFESKGFHHIITNVCREFDKAIIKLVITVSEFGDKNGTIVNEINNKCKSLLTNPNIELIIINKFLLDSDILYFLKHNDLNVFLYEQQHNRGLSSVIDYAISVDTPLCLSNCDMFRHIYHEDISMECKSMKQCMKQNMSYLDEKRNMWSHDTSIVIIENRIDKLIGQTSTCAKRKGIFYNSKRATCSIYESGLQIFTILKQSSFYELDYTEDRIFKNNYDFCIINYHFTTNNWIEESMIQKFKGTSFCIVTEVAFGDNVLQFSPNYIDHYIVIDPTIKVKSRIHAFGRPIKNIQLKETINHPIPIISSFGLATIGKDWIEIIRNVNREFDEAIIRFNIPIGTYNEKLHRQLIFELNEQIKYINLKPGIQFELTHKVMTEEELVQWLSESTINCFFYNREHLFKAGLAAVTDQAIMAEKPILVTKDITFRHLHKYIDFYPNINIKTAIEQNKKGVQEMKKDWSEDNFLHKFETILLH